MTDTPVAPKTTPAVSPSTQAAVVPVEGKPPAARSKVKGDAEPAGKLGDVKFGMSFWGTGTLIAGVASDLAKPVADVAIFLLIAFALATAVTAWLAFFKKPPMAFARTAVGACGIGTAVFTFFLLARTFATPEGLGEERGFIASVAPPVAAVQTAVLPLSDVERELLVFTTQISKGDAEVRSAAARSGLAAATDPATRRALLERTLRSGDANVRQAGLVQALADRGGAPLPIIPDTGTDSPLVRLLTGGQLVLSQVDVVTGAAGGTATLLGSARPLAGNVANGRLIASSQYLTARNRWATGLEIDLALDDRMQLVGTARSPESEAIQIEVPLL